MVEESQDRVLSKIVFILVLGVIAIAPAQYSFGGTDGIPHITPADLLVAAAFLVWLADVVISRRFRSVRFPPLELVLYVVWALAVSLITIFRGGRPGQPLKETAQLTVYFIIAAVLFADVLRNPGRIRWAMYVFLSGGTLVVIAGLVQGLRGPLLAAGPDESVHAIRALFVNNHVLSGYLAMLFPMCAAVLLYRPGRWMKIWAGALAAASLLLVFSGGLLLALIISTAAVAAVGRRKRTVCAVLSVLLLLMIALPFIPKGRGGQILGSVSLYTKWHNSAIVSYRYRRWQSGTNLFRSRPFLGVAPGMFQDHIGKQEYNMLDDGITPTPTPPEDVTISKKFIDNRYILTAAELGLPGLMLLLSILVLACRRALFAFAATDDPSLKAFMAGCFGIVAAVSVGAVFTDFLVRGLALILVFAVCVPCRWVPGEGESS